MKIEDIFEEYQKNPDSDTLIVVQLTSTKDGSHTKAATTVNPEHLVHMHNVFTEIIMTNIKQLAEADPFKAALVLAEIMTSKIDLNDEKADD